MEMMNRAIEDASDFMDMKRKLMRRMDDAVFEAKRDPEQEEMRKVHARAPQPPRRPGENREQYRARIHGKVKA